MDSVIQENTIKTEQEKKQTAPWYCVFPMVMLGVIPPLMPQSAATTTLGITICLALASLVATLIAVLGKRAVFHFRPVQAAALVLLAAALYFGDATLACCAALIIMASGLEFPVWGTTFAVWMCTFVFAARGVMDALGLFTDPLRSMDTVLLVPGAAMVFMLHAGSLGRKSAGSGFSALVFWTVLVILTASAVRTDLISYFIGLAACLVIMAVLHFRLAPRWAGALALFAAAAVIVLGFSWNSWKSGFDHMISSDLPSAALKDVRTEENSAVFELEDGTVLRAAVESDEAGNITKAEFFDAEGILLPLKEDENAPNLYIIDSESYQSLFKLCIIKSDNKNILRVQLADQDWDLVSENGVLYYRNSIGELIKLTGTSPREPAAGPRWLRERRAVWSYAVPLLKEKLWSGHGTEDFGLLHKADPVYRAKCGLDPSLPEDDPRSFYLSQGISTGCIPLAALAVIMIFYAAIYLLRLYKEKQADTEHRHHRAAILAAQICLLITGIANTPQPGTLPLFYMLLGMGLAADHRKRQGGTANGI